MYFTDIAWYLRFFIWTELHSFLRIVEKVLTILTKFIITVFFCTIQTNHYFYCFALVVRVHGQMIGFAEKLSSLREK